MTGKWSVEGVPHKGWTCVDVEDLGEPSATCEMCEVQEIRYVHHMEHPEYPETLHCGCICAGHMEEDIVGAREREKRAARKSRWLHRRWYREVGEWPRYTFTGLEYINTDGYHISVYPRRHDPNVFGFTVTSRDTDHKLIARKDYPTLDAAKLTAFDAMLWLTERGE